MRHKKDLSFQMCSEEVGGWEEALIRTRDYCNLLFHENDWDQTIPAWLRQEKTVNTLRSQKVQCLSRYCFFFHGGCNTKLKETEETISPETAFLAYALYFSYEFQEDVVIRQLYIQFLVLEYVYLLYHHCRFFRSIYVYMHHKTTAKSCSLQK